MAVKAALTAALMVLFLSSAERKWWKEAKKPAESERTRREIV